MASADCFKGCGYYAERIGELIEAKSMLGELWSFLDGVLGGMPEDDRLVLRSYALSGFNRRKERFAHDDKERDKAVHRALMKLSRRVKDRLQRYEKQVNVLCSYYSLVGTS